MPQKKKSSDCQPWPTKEAMEQVYRQKLWGGGDADFYSGTGSHHPEIVEPYLAAVTEFLTAFDQPPTLCDLGCGDFNVGKELAQHTRKYIAADIVPDLIERNRARFQDHRLHFQCLDIAKDDLPQADVAVLRQVLQHLSNAEVKAIAEKLYQYRYIILTEHVPEGAFTPNKDILSGQGIRLKQQSGIDLLCKPFSFKVSEVRQLCTVAPSSGDGVIVTWVYGVSWGG